MQTKIIRFIAIVFIALLIIAGICAVWFYSGGASSRSTWYAVYLDTGDLYFGHLSSFPSLSLSDAWYIQHVSQGDLSINEFSKVSWKPQGAIQINRQHVVWTARIAPDSPLLAAMTARASSNGEPLLGQEINGTPLIPAENGGATSNASSVPGLAH